MSTSENFSTLQVLLVEDNPVDVFMTKQALEESEFNVGLHVVEDGDEAIDFLHENCCTRDTDIPCPDLILLDLNLPKRSGKEVLAEIKRHPYTVRIPVVVLTTSEDPKDIQETYSLCANCYITKPVDVEQFRFVIQSTREFWTQIARLPPRDDRLW